MLNGDLWIKLQDALGLTALAIRLKRSSGYSLWRLFSVSISLILLPATSLTSGIPYWSLNTILYHAGPMTSFDIVVTKSTILLAFVNPGIVALTGFFERIFLLLLECILAIHSTPLPRYMANFSRALLYVRIYFSIVVISPNDLGFF